MAFELPALPWDPSALEPHLTARTLEFHHGKHHQAYVTNLNKLVEGTDLANKSLEEIIGAVAGDPDKQAIFNNAAQVWNHTFFWNSLKPAGGGAPTGDLADRMFVDFGSVEEFKSAFKQAAVGQFGSGWAWLVLEQGKLKVKTTPNADTPLTQGDTPLFTCDVWEHAYYLDYQNRRLDFVQVFLDSLINWEFANKNMGG